MPDMRLAGYAIKRDTPRLQTMLARNACPVPRRGAGAAVTGILTASCERRSSRRMELLGSWGVP